MWHKAPPCASERSSDSAFCAPLRSLRLCVEFAFLFGSGFAGLGTAVFVLSTYSPCLSRNVHRLQRVQAAYPRVQFLPLFGAAFVLGQTAVQQSQRPRQQFRRLPIFQLVAFDLRSQRLENRHRNVLMPGADAELRELQLTVEAGAAVALVGDLTRDRTACNVALSVKCPERCPLRSVGEPERMADNDRLEHYRSARGSV